MKNQGSHLIDITDPTQDRYAALRLIDWWDQERVQNAHLMVIGAGALGNEVLKNLALLGVGYIFLVDFDTVEASNLTRSVLFRPEDGGRFKAEVAAESLHKINPDVHVQPFCGDVTHDLGLGVFRQMDVIIGCLDNRAARLAVNQACWHIQRPWVDGALDVMDGLVRTFMPPDDACYECTLTEQDYALLNLRYSCPPGFTLTTGRQPTTPMIASIIAAMQVQEAMKLLHGLPVSSGQATYYSGMGMRLTQVKYTRRDECPSHLMFEPIISLPYGVDDLTVGQFLDLVSSYGNGENMIRLFLPRQIVTVFHCPTCATDVPVYRPYEDVVPVEVPCPHCGKLRLYSNISYITASAKNHNIPLSQLGITHFSILPVQLAQRWQYFELSADKDSIMNRQEK